MSKETEQKEKKAAATAATTIMEEEPAEAPAATGPKKRAFAKIFESEEAGTTDVTTKTDPESPSTKPVAKRAKLESEGKQIPPV